MASHQISPHHKHPIVPYQYLHHEKERIIAVSVATSHAPPQLPQSQSQSSSSRRVFTVSHRSLHPQELPSCVQTLTHTHACTRTSTPALTLTRTFTKSNDNTDEDSNPNSIEQPKLFHFLNENSIQLNGDSTLKELAEMNSQEREKYPVLDLLLTSFPEDLKLKTALELFKLIEGLKNDPGISKEDIEKIINPAPQYSSIQDALEGLANKETVPGALSLPDTLHRLNVHIEKGAEGGDNDNDPEEKYCYFFTDGTIKLRHEGDDKLMPSKIFLHDRQEDVKLPKVLVYCTGSGTGKTVELVGSSASRGMDLGIIFTVQDNTSANEVQDKNERNTASMVLLKEKMKEVLKRNPKLKTFIDLATDERPLKINIGLDEAFECPKLVRSIIAERQLAWETVVEALVDDTKDVKDNQTARIIVSFSVAGKGAHIGVVGSNSQNFETVKPSA